MAEPDAVTATSHVAARVATPELLRHLVTDVLRQEAVRKRGGAVVIGVRAQPTWVGASITVDSHEVMVVPCASPLAMRVAFADHLPETGAARPSATIGPVLVLLTDVDETAVGDDVLARLVKPKLFGLDVWQTVKARLGVRRLDPALGEATNRWLAEALLDVPANETSIRNGSLSIDRAVDLVVAATFGLDHVSLEQLLLAAADPVALARFTSASDPVRTGLTATLTARFGPVGALVLGALLRGNGPDALAVGLAARAVVGHVAGSYAQARIEDLTGVAAPDDAAIEALASLAELAFTDLAATQVEATDALLAKADVWVRELQGPNPGSSTVLRSGFEARLSTLGRAVSALAAEIGKPGEIGKADDPVELDDRVSAIRTAVTSLQAHRETNRPTWRTRAEGAVLAARLALWLASGRPGDPADLAAASTGYRDQGAWVDWARRRVFAGDSNEELAAAQRAVGAAADIRRSEENRHFAELLARSTKHDDPGADIGDALPVESVIDAVVLPLAKTVPVLLVVLDGCGLPSFLELAPQFRSRGLLEFGPNGDRRVGVAALPTVTEVSRTSLLAGKLRTGNQADEKREFAAHPGLAALPGAAPVVFHAADLRSEGGAALPAIVRNALGPAGPRVVAAVVNTIDDQLARGTFAAAHRIEDLGSLPWLLAHAIDNGRAVVITADHGHVLGIDVDGRGAAAIGGEGGERWRMADRAPTDDEVVVVGQRVLLGDARGVLMPWHDVLRYAGYHGGYHGGATPDEVLVPLSVYLPAGIEPPSDWDQVVAAAPAWWDLAAPAMVEPAPESVPESAPEPKRPAARKKVEPAENQGALFAAAESSAVPAAGASDAPRHEASGASTGAAGAPVPAVPPWVSALLASDVFKVQLGALGRAKPTPERVTSTLVVLAVRGGVASFSTIADATSMSLTRVSPFVATLTRLLNVDGYPILTVDHGGQEVRLDIALARTQFLAES